MIKRQNSENKRISQFFKFKSIKIIRWITWKLNWISTLCNNKCSRQWDGRIWRCLNGEPKDVVFFGRKEGGLAVLNEYRGMIVEIGLFLRGGYPIFRGYQPWWFNETEWGSTGMICESDVHMSNRLAESNGRSSRINLLRYPFYFFFERKQSTKIPFLWYCILVLLEKNPKKWIILKKSSLADPIISVNIVIPVQCCASLNIPSMNHTHIKESHVSRITPTIVKFILYWCYLLWYYIFLFNLVTFTIHS